jgi:hypothetical protein
VFEIMQRENLFTRPAEIGATLMARLKDLAARHEVIGEIRGRGLLIGIEFVTDRKTRRPFPERQAFTGRLVKAMRDRNVLVAAGAPQSNLGRHGDHIQLSPPFIISESEVSQITEALDDALVEVARHAETP